MDKFKTFLFYAMFAVYMFAGGAFGHLLLPWYYGLIIGGSLFIPLAVLAYSTRKSRVACIIVIAVNGFLSGMAVSTYYTLNLLEFDYLYPLAVTGVVISLFLGLSLLIRTILMVEHPILTGLPLCTVILGVSIFLWAFYGEPVFAYATFAALGLISFVPALLMQKQKKRSVYRHSVMSSFSALIAIGIVVLIVLSKGEAAEGLFDGFAPGSMKSKKKHKSLK